MAEACAIEITDLSYQVDGRPVLEGVSLQVRQGEVVAVMGLSGSGKTSLLRCIMGLVRPPRGSIRVLGTEIMGLPERQLNQVRKSIGLVFQYAALFDSMTVGENVAFAIRQHTALSPAAVERIVADRLAMVGLAGTEHRMPAQLSGGMRKRVGIARALALEPKIMLYDEPTSGLDPITARAIYELIVDLRDRLGVSSLVVSHDITSLLRMADRLALLYNHRLVAVGAPAELQRSSDPLVQQFLEGRTSGPISVV